MGATNSYVGRSQFIDIDSLDTPKDIEALLKRQAAWAKQILADPAVQWRTGNSHDIARQILADAQDIYSDLALDHGLYTDKGFVGIADS